MPLNIDSELSMPGFNAHIPACFTSLEEVQNSFHYHQNRRLKAINDLNDTATHSKSAIPLIEAAYLESYSQGRKAIRSVLGKWGSAFEAYLLKSTVNMSSKELLGAAVLNINHRLAILHTEKHGEDDLHMDLAKPISWDNLHRECGEILDLATSVIKLHNNSTDPTSENRPLFSMDMTIVGPLFSIAHRCRDPKFRRRAIALLYSAQRQEGLWHSVLTARVAEKIMNMEEAGLGEVKKGEDVPDTHRIHAIHVRFDMEGRKGYLKLRRRQNTGQRLYIFEPVTEVLEEVIDW